MGEKASICCKKGKKISSPVDLSPNNNDDHQHNTKKEYAKNGKRHTFWYNKFTITTIRRMRRMPRPESNTTTNNRAEVVFPTLTFETSISVTIPPYHHAYSEREITKASGTVQTC